PEASVAVPITLNNAPAEAAVSSGSDGSAWVQFERQRIHFPHGALWNPDKFRRGKILDGILNNITLTAKCAQEGRMLVEADPFSLETFVRAAGILSSAPEEFARRLGTVIRGNSVVNETDLLPEDPLHWYQLAPPPQNSRMLKDYIENELSA